MADKLTILSIDLLEPQLEAVQHILDDRFAIRRMAFIDLPAAITAAAKEAALILIRWDGPTKKALNLLLQMPAAERGAAPVYAITSSPDPKQAPSGKELKVLKIAGAIQMPARYFEIQTILYDMVGERPVEDTGAVEAAPAPTGEPPAADVASAKSSQPPANAAATTAPATAAKPAVKSTQPAPAGAKPAPGGAKPAPGGAKPAPAGANPAPAGANPAPAGVQPPTTGAQPAAAKPAARVLKVPVVPAMSPANVLTMVTRAWVERAKANIAPPCQQLVAVHQIEAFGTELAKLFTHAGAKGVQATQTEAQAMAAIRRGAAGVVIWYDGENPLGPTVLEQLAETRHQPWIPILIFVPGKSAVEVMAKRHAHVFFDSIAIFDRRPSAVQALYTRFTDAIQSPVAGAPRVLMSQLRDGAQGGTKPIDLATARQLSTALATKPGKTYWSRVELLSHLVRAKLNDEVKKEVDLIVAEQPQAYTTLMLRHAIDFNFADNANAKCAAARAMVKEIMAMPDLTADRLYRLADRLVQMKAATVLGEMVDLWFANPKFKDDHQLFFAASRYCRMVGDLENEGNYLAQAIAKDMLRFEYLDALAMHFCDKRMPDRAVEITKLVLANGGQNAERQARLVRHLAAARRLNDARQELVKMVQAFPTHPEAEALKKLVA